MASGGIRSLGDVCFQRTVSDVGAWTRPLIGWPCVLVCPGQSRLMARVDCCMLINYSDSIIFDLSFSKVSEYDKIYLHLMQARGLREGFLVDCPADLGHCQC